MGGAGCRVHGGLSQCALCLVTVCVCVYGEGGGGWVGQIEERGDRWKRERIDGWWEKGMG